MGFCIKVYCRTKVIERVYFYLKQSELFLKIPKYGRYQIAAAILTVELGIMERFHNDQRNILMYQKAHTNKPINYLILRLFIIIS
ncbi:hypothetical protein HZS_6447, partial [Henneguya salminicola]